jgi:hypothetical protein
MGRERFLFLPLAPPCGSALWHPDLSGRKSWRYSPESPAYVEAAFSEVRYSRVLGCPVTRGTPSGGRSLGETTCTFRYISSREPLWKGAAGVCWEGH